MPQIMWQHNFTPDIWSRLALTYTGPLGATLGGQTAPDTSAGGLNVNSATGLSNTGGFGFPRSYLPALQGAFQYETKGCGTIGPRGLIFGAGGVYAIEKKTWDRDRTAVVALDDENIKSWEAFYWMHIPIVPEKNQNKTGAVAFTGGATVGSNATQYIGGNFGGASYNRTYNTAGALDAANPNWAAPTGYGWYAGMEFYLSNEFAIIPSFSAWRMSNLSNQYQLGNPNKLVRDDTYNLAFRYDPNPAIRLAVEFMHDYAKYADYGRATPGDANSIALQDNRGKLNAARFSAWYFF